MSSFQTKMMYRQSNNRRKLSLFVLILMIIGVFSLSVVFGLFNKNIHYFFGSLTQKIIFGVASIQGGVKNTAIVFSTLLGDKQALIKENEELKIANETLEAVTLLRDLLLEENTELKESLGRVSTDRLLRGVVLSSPEASPYDTFIIDIGSSDGVVANELVSYSGIIIGRIAEVYGQSSLVKLLSAPGEEYDVRIGSPAVSAKAVGRGGGNFEVTLPRGILVSEGDRVVVPSISSRPFGIVGAVGQGNSPTFQKILFRNPFNLFYISAVDVIIEK